MLLIVSATGAFGFLFSFLMLKVGVSAMWLRYPLAVGFSYFMFLSLLRMWLSLQVSWASAHTHYDAVDGFLDVGHFVPDSVFDGASGGGPAGDAVGALDFDEWIFVAVAVAALCVGFLVCVYLVWAGPSLLAEVLVDGFVMSRVYKRMKVTGKAYWVSGALRRTWIAAVLVAVFFGVAGFAMQKIVPGAHSIGPVVERVMDRV